MVEIIAAGGIEAPQLSESGAGANAGRRAQRHQLQAKGVIFLGHGAEAGGAGRRQGSVVRGQGQHLSADSRLARGDALQGARVTAQQDRDRIDTSGYCGQRRQRDGVAQGQRLQRQAAEQLCWRWSRNQQERCHEKLAKTNRMMKSGHAGLNVPAASFHPQGQSLDSFERGLVELLPRLRRFARNLARDPTDADDLVQLAIERALVARAQWQADTRLDAWMYRIVRNCWIDEVRRRGRQAAHHAPPEAADAVGVDPLPALERRMTAAAVAKALWQLPDEQREAVALVLVEGLSYRDAAAALEVPVGTLTSRLGRGRAALLCQFEDRP